jgi:hypothetical protein
MRPGVGSLGSSLGARGAHVGGLGSQIINPHVHSGSRLTTPGSGVLTNRSVLGSGLSTHGHTGGHTALRPGIGGTSGLGGIAHHHGGAGIGSAGIGSAGIGSAGIGSAGIGSAGIGASGFHHGGHGGHVTPQSLNNFLSMHHRGGGIGAGGFANGGRGSGFPISHVGGRGGINNSFNNINITQLNRINNNINTGFRHHHGFGYYNGYGFNRFGYGFGSPYWNNWGFGVRSFWNPYGYWGLFSPRFWATNYCYFPWYRSYYWWGSGYPYSYWWNTPTWGGLTSWFPSYGWSTPYYYGYGPGGNITINNGYVYMNDLPIATTADYAASAANLATVPTPTNPDQPAEWMPLGTFALSASETDKNPSRVVQLAVDKDGIISGTMYNQDTKQTYPIQGRVDKETQRVAFTIGDAKDVVFETGIYNLTQQETPILAHGDGREETYLLLRLEPPKDEGAATATPGTATPGTATPGTATPGTATPGTSAPGTTTPVPPPAPPPAAAPAPAATPEAPLSAATETPAATATADGAAASAAAISERAPSSTASSGTSSASEVPPPPPAPDQP